MNWYLVVPLKTNWPECYDRAANAALSFGETMDITIEVRKGILFVEPMTDIGHEWIDEYAHEFSPYRYGDKVMANLKSLPRLKELMDNDGIGWEMRE